jgi:hypothetical protein
MVRHLRDLKAMRQQEVNRLESNIIADVVHDVLQQHIAFLDSQIAELQRRIHDHLDQNPDLKRQRDLLDSIPGLGDTTIPLLLAEIRDIAAFRSAAQLAALLPATIVLGLPCVGAPVSLNAAMPPFVPPSTSLRWSPCVTILSFVLLANALRPLALLLPLLLSLQSASFYTLCLVFSSPNAHLTRISLFKFSLDNEHGILHDLREQQ